MKNKVVFLLIIWALFNYADIISFSALNAQSAMINVSARHCIDLDGRWQIIIDPTGSGDWRKVWQEKSGCLFQTDQDTG